MKLKSSTIRKLRNLLSLLSEMNVPDIPSSDDEIKSSEFTKLWKFAELANLLDSWNSLYLISSTPKRSEIVERLKLLEYKASEYSVLQLSKNPKIIMICIYEQSFGSNQQKFLADRFQKQTIYYLPKQGYFLSSDISDKVAKSLFGEITKKRLRAMDLSEIFNSDRRITYLSIKATHEISGFHGLEEIIFHGKNVKQGLHGLHKRQDIRVNIDQIGPRVAVSTDNFDLKIGANLRIKTMDGLSEILEIL